METVLLLFETRFPPLHCRNISVYGRNMESYEYFTLYIVGRNDRLIYGVIRPVDIWCYKHYFYDRFIFFNFFFHILMLDY